jgi:tRNA(Ile2) C34 agmatinyltransferase TiaS
MKPYFIGIDDTDNSESRGTGHLARFMSAALAKDFHVHGVTRHQLLLDKRVPMTAKNSSAGILFEGDEYPLAEIAAYARKVMLDDFQPGSDPGLCVGSAIPAAIVSFGDRAKREFLHQGEAWKLASEHRLFLEGLGGDDGGVIGALAAVGLAAEGNDGRYVQIGSIRELDGLQSISAVLDAGITCVTETNGEQVTEGLVLVEKIRPARRNGQPVLFVERKDDYWLPLKLD